MSDISFQSWLKNVCGQSPPRTWQTTLANGTNLASRIIRVPTGLGKAEGVLAAWSYNLVCRGNSTWPRRLVWCLPSRSLVEPTYAIATSLANSINKTISVSESFQVHATMGGENNSDWFLYPERPTIIVGTQETLLSRALNRGFGSSRSRWPIEFGLLNQDCLWVLDEAPLMDVGLTTSAQLQAYRDQDRSKSLKPCHTWWIGSTLQPQWLDSVDTRDRIQEWLADPCVISNAERSEDLYHTPKPLSLKSIEATETRDFAEVILDRHRNLPTDVYGRLTLVICNTVKRACETFDQLLTIDLKHDVKLIHHQFRPVESESWRLDFLSPNSRNSSTDRIVISTPVLEAGVTFSADCLVTELAPWSSLIQRFGLCTHDGRAAEVIVIDRGRDSKAIPPYKPEELDAAYASLEKIRDVGIKSLEDYEGTITETERSQLYSYTPSHLLMRTEFDELFDTTSDLSCDDIDVSRFIRSGEERDLQIFWAKLDKDASPSPQRQPQRQELCPVKVADACNWLFGEETKSSRMPNLLPRMKRRAWIWDWIDGRWVTPRRNDLLPGKIVCIASNRGGYSTLRGFDPDSTAEVPEVPGVSTLNTVWHANVADSQLASDSLSFSGCKTLVFHSQEVVDCVASIGSALHLDPRLIEILTIAARWHDIGKAHPAFQSILSHPRRGLSRAPALLAKSVAESRAGLHFYADEEGHDERLGFRHEFASALAIFAVLQIYHPDHPALLGEWKAWLTQSVARTAVAAASRAGSIDLSECYDHVGSEANNHIQPEAIETLLNCSAAEIDLILYLVASHHGKVRNTLYSTSTDQSYVDRLNDGRGLPVRGVREGDILPALEITAGDISLPELTLTLEPASLGLSPKTGRSWSERTSNLLSLHGPSMLAYLEAILRSADVRASLLTTSDPLCEIKEIE